jgi:Flp pilus assembly protein TadD
VKRPMTILLCLGLAIVAVAPAHAQGPNDSKTVPVQGSPEATTSVKAPVAAATPVDSVALLARAVAKDSTHFENLYRLGVMYLDRDKPNDAVTVLTKAHVLRPKDHKVCVNLGVAHDAAGQPSLAQTYYYAALKEFPEDSVASCRLASSLYSQSKHAEAVSILQGIVHKSPRAYCAYFTLGVAFADAGIYKDAIRMWRKVLEIAPSSPEAVSARESIDVLEKFVSSGS